MIKGFSVESGDHCVKIVVNPSTSLTLYRRSIAGNDTSKVVVFSVGDPLRLKIKNNWIDGIISQITDLSISIEIVGGTLVRFSFYDFQKIYFQG